MQFYHALTCYFVGMIDTGVDDSSCFFVDDSGIYMRDAQCFIHDNSHLATPPFFILVLFTRKYMHVCMYVRMYVCMLPPVLS